MANKKANPKKSAPKKTIITKIAGQVGHLAGELVARKDHLVEMAGEAIESVKSSIQTITAAKKTVAKKTVKATAKKAVTKSTGAAIKKSARPVAAKKTAPSTKTAKKVVKKVVKKTAGKK